MEIVKRVVHRQITQEEFLRLKNIEPFSTFRQDSKPINFGMIFGISFKKFSSSTLETSWSYEKVKAFIKDKNLYDSVETMAEKYSYHDPKLWDYYAVSDFLKKEFFKAYPGLLDRIERNKQFAIDNGYIRSFHGAIRRVPLLMFCMGDDGKLRKDENLKEIANLFNITSNTSIQTDEVVKVMSCINKWSTKESIDTILIATVHDSIDVYTTKNENSVIILKKMKKFFEEKEEWQNGLLFPIDFTICDIENNDYYKHGMSIEKLEEVKRYKK